MSKKWAETGILRKKQTTENFDDLLVFGYACKLFRDDERALYIDQGKHLIPWMGNDGLKIDRYDGRGALSDLSCCEASRQVSLGWPGLTESERKLERMCDEERYYSLHNNEEEEMYKDNPPGQQMIIEFKYDYDVPANPTTSEEEAPIVLTCEEENKVYVPPNELNVPIDMEIPERVKENVRIEKTAVFVSQQGPQMEILIKAKQSDNPQFGFMNQNHPLHKYYRHLLNAIKSGQYKPHAGFPDEENDDENAADSNVNDASDGEHYLHPSLAMTFNVPTTQTVMRPPPAIALPYKPAADCAYTQLVSRIKGTAALEKPPPAQPPPPAESAAQAAAGPQESDVSEQYYKYYQAQYYQYYQQIAQQYATQGNCDITIILQNLQLQEQIQQQAVHYAQAACAHFTPTQQPSIPPKVDNAQVTTLPPVATQATEPPAAMKSESKVSLVVYSSDSDENDADSTTEDEKSTFTIPPKDVAVIVDKMATYVAKNGVSFEQGVKAKGDPRFDFLHDSHIYYKYYRHRVNEFSPKTNSKCEVQAKVDRTTKPQPSENVIKPKEKKIVSAVSFSIKKSKEESPKDIKSALQAEESDEENISANRVSPPAQVTTTSVAEVLCPPKAAVVANTTTDLSTVSSGRGFGKDRCEMIDLTQEPSADKPDARQRLAEERIKDRLASAVREKTLQMERKKRAGQFLRMQSGRRSEDRRIVRADDASSTDSESDLEEGEIKQRAKNSRRKKSSHKRSKSSRSRRSRSRSRSKSRHRKSKRRRRSPRYRSSSSDSE